MERWIERIGRLAGYATAVLGPLCLGLIFFYAPLEATMGLVQKIFYIHVPMAILCYLGFAVTAVGGGLYLWTGQRSYDRVALAGAEVGVLFCTLVLITGPLWAKPVWGVAWTWEARLTWTLILWFIYVAYLLLRRFTDGEETGARFAAVLGILGVGMIPFIRIAVERFRGNHPGNPFKAGLPPEMAHTFYTCLALFLCLLLYTLGRRVTVERRRDEVRALRMADEER